MDDPLVLCDILRRCGGKPAPPSPKFRRWLERHGIPEAALATLKEGFLGKSVYVGAIDFYSEAGIMEVNGEHAVPIALAAGLLIVGSCPNGDPVAVDVRQMPGQAGYLCCETMWQQADARSAFRPLATSLGGLAEGLVNGSMPCDYHEKVG